MQKLSGIQAKIDSLNDSQVVILYRKAVQLYYDFYRETKANPKKYKFGKSGYNFNPLFESEDDFDLFFNTNVSTASMRKVLALVYRNTLLMRELVANPFHIDNTDPIPLSLLDIDFDNIETPTLTLIQGEKE